MYYKGLEIWTIVSINLWYWWKIGKVLAWGVGFVPHSAFSKIERDNDLTTLIWMNKVIYAKDVKATWNV
jgi:hypothetical protein